MVDEDTYFTYINIQQGEVASSLSGYAAVNADLVSAEGKGGYLFLSGGLIP